MHRDLKGLNPMLINHLEGNAQNNVSGGSDQLHAPASSILPSKIITGVSTMLHEPAEFRLATFRSFKHVQWSHRLNPTTFYT